MESTNAKTGGWLANYYLRGVIAIAAALLTWVALGVPGLPLFVGAGVWFVLWLVAKARA